MALGMVTTVQNHIHIDLLPYLWNLVRSVQKQSHPSYLPSEPPLRTDNLSNVSNQTFDICFVKSFIRLSPKVKKWKKTISYRQKFKDTLFPRTIDGNYLVVPPSITDCYNINTRKTMPTTNFRHAKQDECGQNSQHYFTSVSKSDF